MDNLEKLNDLRNQYEDLRKMQCYSSDHTTFKAQEGRRIADEILLLETQIENEERSTGSN